MATPFELDVTSDVVRVLTETSTGTLIVTDEVMVAMMNKKRGAAAPFTFSESNHSSGCA
jgi:hypothetical protein